MAVESGKILGATHRGSGAYAEPHFEGLGTEGLGSVLHRNLAFDFWLRFVHAQPMLRQTFGLMRQVQDISCQLSAFRLIWSIMTAGNSVFLITRNP